MEIIDPKGKIKKFLLQILKKYNTTKEIHISPQKSIFLKTKEKNIIKINLPKEKLNSYFLSFYNILTDNQKEELKEKEYYKTIEIINNYIIKLIYYKEVTGFVVNMKILENTDLDFNKTFENSLLNELININNGAIIISGPKESGKTSSLYTLINENINKKSQHIIIIEENIKKFIKLNENNSLIIRKEFSNENEKNKNLILNSLMENPDIIIIDKNTFFDDNMILLTKILVNNGVKVYFSFSKPDLYSILKILKNIYENDILLIKYIINQRIISLKDNTNQLIYEIFDLEKNREILLNSNFLKEMTKEEFYSFLEREGNNTIRKQLKKLLEEQKITKEEYFKNYF